MRSTLRRSSRATCLVRPSSPELSSSCINVELIKATISHAVGCSLWSAFPQIYLLAGFPPTGASALLHFGRLRRAKPTLALVQAVLIPGCSSCGSSATRRSSRACTSTARSRRRSFRPSGSQSATCASRSPPRPSRRGDELTMCTLQHHPRRDGRRARARARHELRDSPQARQDAHARQRRRGSRCRRRGRGRRLGRDAGAARLVGREAARRTDPLARFRRSAHARRRRPKGQRDGACCASRRRARRLGCARRRAAREQAAARAGRAAAQHGELDRVGDSARRDGSLQYVLALFLDSSLCGRRADGACPQQTFLGSSRSARSCATRASST